MLVALGGFPVEVVPAAEREALTAKLLVVYREHPDPGLHGAIDWLLRQKWGKTNEVAAIDAELAAAIRAKVLARGWRTSRRGRSRWGRCGPRRG